MWRPSRRKKLANLLIMMSLQPYLDFHLSHQEGTLLNPLVNHLQVSHLQLSHPQVSHPQVSPPQVSQLINCLVHHLSHLQLLHQSSQLLQDLPQVHD